MLFPSCRLHNNNQVVHIHIHYVKKTAAVWQAAGRMQQVGCHTGGSNSAFLGSSLGCPHQQLLPRGSSRPRKPHRFKLLPAAAAAPGVQPPEQAAAPAVLPPAKQPLIRLSRRKRTLSWPRWERKLFESLLAVDQEQVSQEALSWLPAWHGCVKWG